MKTSVKISELGLTIQCIVPPLSETINGKSSNISCFFLAGGNVTEDLTGASLGFRPQDLNAPFN